MTISPKSRFQQNQSDAKLLSAIVKEDWFNRACEYALLAYQQRMTTATQGDLTSSAVGFHRIAGASEVLHELLNLSEVPSISERKPLGQLNQRA